MEISITEANKHLKNGLNVEYMVANGDWQSIKTKTIPKKLTNGSYLFRLSDIQIKAGQFWKRKEGYFALDDRKYKILAYEEGYAMLRAYGGNNIPFVQTKIKLLDEFILLE